MMGNIIIIISKLDSINYYEQYILYFCTYICIFNMHMQMEIQQYIQDLR